MDGAKQQKHVGRSSKHVFLLLYGQQGLDSNGRPHAVDHRPEKGAFRSNYSSIAHPGERFDGVRWQASPKAKMQQKWSDQDRKRTQSSLEGNVHSRACKWAVDGKTLADWAEITPHRLILDIFGTGGVMKVERGQLVHDKGL